MKLTVLCEKIVRFRKEFRSCRSVCNQGFGESDERKLITTYFIQKNMSFCIQTKYILMVTIHICSKAECAIMFERTNLTMPRSLMRMLESSWLFLNSSYRAIEILLSRCLIQWKRSMLERIVFCFPHFLNISLTCFSVAKVTLTNGVSYFDHLVYTSGVQNYLHRKYMSPRNGGLQSQRWGSTIHL